MLNRKPPLADTAITLMFDKGGRIAGSGGCNRYAAGITLEGTALKIGQAISTRMACPEPIMAQESAYLQALAKVSGFATEEGALVLRDAAGAELLRFSRTA